MITSLNPEKVIIPCALSSVYPNGFRHDNLVTEHGRILLFCLAGYTGRDLLDGHSVHGRRRLRRHFSVFLQTSEAEMDVIPGLDLVRLQTQFFMDPKGCRFVPYTLSETSRCRWYPSAGYHHDIMPASPPPMGRQR